MRLSLFSLLPIHAVEPDRDLYETALGRAELAEELGFHGFWVAEHHARAISQMPSPAVFLAAASQRTRRIRLGAAVAVLSVRHPLFVAEDYALVDRLSGGRLELGVGSGASPVELTAVGVAPDDKRARFEEGLDILRHAWAREGGPIEGRFHQIGDAFCSVRPAQKPAPPLWRAVGGVDAARAAGEAGDGALLLTAPDLANHEDIVAMAAAHRVGREAASADTSRARVAAALFTSVAATDAEAQARAIRGFDRLAAARQQPADGEDVVAAAVAGGRAFLGSPATIVSHLQTLAEVGIDEALLWLDFGGAPEAEIEEGMRLIAAEVAAALAAVSQ